MRARAIELLGVLAIAALAGCTGGQKREAESLVVAVERFRRADNGEKPAAADALRAVPCTAADVCSARDACVASADATAKALRLKHEVEISLAALEHGTLAKETPEAQALPAKLDEAEVLLKDGFERLKTCDDRIQDLKRKNGI